MKNKIIIAGFLILLIPSISFALSLDEAKSKGLVGEKRNGYLGVVKDSPEVKALVSDINAKRKAQYGEIAKKNGTALNAVENLAGEKAVEKTSSGNYIQDSSGSWKKK